MRRLPVFFVLDVSESMVGAPLAALEEGVARIVSLLRKDPHSLETVFISVIAFAGKAEVISPLVDLTSFYAPRLPIGGGTALGEALNELMAEIDAKVTRQSKTVHGDWEPLVFLITDGKPTDQPDTAIRRWLDVYSSRASIVAITLGDNADIPLLKRLTPDVLVYEGSTEADFKRFVDWITASVTTTSKEIEGGRMTDGVQLAKTGSELTPVNDELPMLSDPDFVILTGRCQATKRPYLIKYVLMGGRNATRALTAKQRFVLDGCFPLTEEYFLWTAQGKHEQVNTNALEGAPGCPHCGNLTTIALCGGCGQLMCVNGPDRAICPWCGAENNFVADSGHFDLSRSQG